MCNAFVGMKCHRNNFGSLLPSVGMKCHRNNSGVALWENDCGTIITKIIEIS